MPYAQAKGARLHYEVAGRGHPIIFVHEFAGDQRSWEPQVRYFSRRYRCITYNARGYPPSEVPSAPALYSQDNATDDIAAVLKHLKVKKAHVVGLSMGGFAALHFAIRYPRLVSAAVVAGCGYGAPKSERAGFRAEVRETVKRFRAEGMAAVAKDYGAGPTRVQLQNKDPRGFVEFNEQLAEHSAEGMALTMQGVQGKRPSIYDLTAKMKQIKVPVLLLTGDEDEPCLDANVYMKRMIPTSGLTVMPKTGHTANLEEPAAFNQALQEFFASAEQGRWGTRDPRSLSAKLLTVTAGGKKK
ncbi:MAG: alpha/beta hydrolase [Alphaproteobacteria bacterium]|jgi:pimeloyl-ACP methyl ester carboxylesterase|nr:alpha/beta hydrolase [Alphaproteobacteria bacterium]